MKKLLLSVLLVAGCATQMQASWASWLLKKRTQAISLCSTITKTATLCYFLTINKKTLIDQKNKCLKDIATYKFLKSITPNIRFKKPTPTIEYTSSHEYIDRKIAALDEYIAILDFKMACNASENKTESIFEAVKKTCKAVITKLQNATVRKTHTQEKPAEYDLDDKPTDDAINPQSLQEEAA